MSDFDEEHEWLGERPPRRQAMGDLEMSGGSGERGDGAAGLGYADPDGDFGGLGAGEPAPGETGSAGSGPADGTESHSRRTGKRLAY